MKSKDQNTTLNSQKSRLAAYSVMATGALALMSSAEGAIIPGAQSVPSTTLSPTEAVMLQEQQVQSQKERFNINSKMRVLDGTSCSNPPPPPPAE